MWKIALLIVLALVLGLSIGWYLRGEAAKSACEQVGGEWAPNNGHCMGAIYGDRSH